MTSITQACVPVEILAFDTLNLRLDALCTEPEKTKSSYDILALEVILTIEEGTCYRTIAPHNVLLKTPGFTPKILPWFQLDQDGAFKADLHLLTSAFKSLEWYTDGPLESAIEKMHKKSERPRSQYSVLLAGGYGAVRRNNFFAYEQVFLSSKGDDLIDLQQFVDSQSMILTAKGLSSHERLVAAKKGEKIAALFGAMNHPRATGAIKPDLRFEAL